MLMEKLILFKNHKKLNFSILLLFNKESVFNITAKCAVVPYVYAHKNKIVLERSSNFTRQLLLLFNSI